MKWLLLLLIVLVPGCVVKETVREVTRFRTLPPKVIERVIAVPIQIEEEAPAPADEEEDEVPTMLAMRR